MVAQELIAAAGLRGKQNWALILSSSARVSEVTYETVVAVRYPELDAAINTRVVFGNYLADRQARIGVTYLSSGVRLTVLFTLQAT